MQPQLIAQRAARAILGGADLADAQESPSWTISDFGPGSRSRVSLEPDVPDAVVEGLEDRGHSLERFDRRQPGWGPMSIIELDGSERRAAADPRVDTATALVF